MPNVNGAFQSRRLIGGNLSFLSPMLRNLHFHYCILTVGTHGCQNTCTVTASDWMQPLFDHNLSSLTLIFRSMDVRQENAIRATRCLNFCQSITNWIKCTLCMASCSSEWAKSCQNDQQWSFKPYLLWVLFSRKEFCRAKARFAVWTTISLEVWIYITDSHCSVLIIDGWIRFIHLEHEGHKLTPPTRCAQPLMLYISWHKGLLQVLNNNCTYV